jgi:electron transport complex protein RnfG
MSESESATKETSFRDTIGYQALLLGGFAFLATALLVLGNLATKDAIAERKAEDLRASLSQVLPPEIHDNDLLEHPMELDGPDGKPLTIYRAIRDKQVTGVAYEVVGKGYAGDIRLILGLDAKGKVLGVRVLSHAETPGLGDKIEASRGDWILGFNGLSMGAPPEKEWYVDKDGGRFDSFSGATITPRAVVAAIRGGLHYFADYRTALTAPVVITKELEGAERVAD